MIKFSFLLLISLTSSISFAMYQKQGIVYYDQVIDIHANLRKDQQMLKSVIPQFRTSKKELHFSGNLAKIMDGKKAKTIQGIQFMNPNGKSITLLNYDAKESIVLTEIANRKYQVKKEIQQNDNIEYTDETKEILGYQCKKTILKRVTINGDGDENEQIFTIWYTKDKGLKGGPTSNINVPGLILNMKSKSLEYKATAVEFISIDQSSFDVPAGYKKVSSQQLSDLQEEAREELLKSVGN